MTRLVLCEVVMTVQPAFERWSASSSPTPRTPKDWERKLPTNKIAFSFKIVWLLASDALAQLQVLLGNLGGRFKIPGGLQGSPAQSGTQLLIPGQL